MSGLRYFAYGSNLDVEQMRARCPGSRVLYRARLLDHRLDFTHFSQRWQGGAADVIPSRAGSVWGLIYALETDDLPRLDRYEGGYERILVDVLDDREAAVGVLTYTVREKRRYRPTVPYLDQMIRAGRRWQFPEDYLEALERLRSD